MKLLLFIIFTLSACTSQRGTFQTEIPTPAKDCDKEYIRCMQKIKIKDQCDRQYDACDLQSYDLEKQDIDLE